MANYHKKFKATWKRLLKKRPLRPLLCLGRLGQFNETQKDLIANWPPKIVFKNFPNIGKMCISAKERWFYPSQQAEKEAYEKEMKRRKPQTLESNIQKRPRLACEHARNRTGDKRSLQTSLTRYFSWKKPKSQERRPPEES